MTEEVNEQMDESEQDPEAVLREVEQQVEALHDQLDQIKQAGQSIPREIEETLPEDPDQETVMEYQQVLNAANLLYRRVESGDKNIVRGE